MGQAEELLNSLAGATPYVEADYVTIGKDRFMVVPDNLKKLGVSPDHGVNTIHFVGPRYSENGSDLSEMSIWVNFMRSDDYPDSCRCTNVKVDADDETLLHYDWEISRNVTEVHGNLTILVCAKEVDEAGIEKDHWNSELNRDFYVSEGLEVQDSVISQYPDLIEYMLLRVATVENKTTKAYVLNCVKEYLSGDPSVIIEHIEGAIAEQPIDQFVQDYLDRYVDICTTENLTLEGSFAGAYEMVSMAGVSEQAQLEGKNLYNKATSTDGYGVGNSGDVYVDDTASASDYIEIESGASYSHTNVEWAQWYDENKNYIGIGTGKIMTAPSNAKYARLTVRIVNKDSAQFELGEVTSPYEPYCGGKPSPNSEYPQEIKSVGTELTVRTHGENILGGLRFANMLIESGVRATIDEDAKTVEIVADANTKKFSYSNFKENTQYTFFIRGYNNDSNYAQVTNLRIVYTDGTDGFLSFASNKSQTTIISSAGKTIAQLVGIFAASSSVIHYEDFGIMEGIHDLKDFKPYQESTVQIALSDKLRSNGDVRDTLEKRDGKWGVLRKIASVIFNGSENWYKYNQGGNDYCHYTILPNVKTGTNQSACSHFRYIHYVWDLQDKGYGDHGSLPNAYFSTEFTTVDEWKAWLSKNPVTYDYQVAEPTWEELDAASQEALDNLLVYDGITHVIVESDIQPVVTSKYGTSEVGARTLTNSNLIARMNIPENMAATVAPKIGYVNLLADSWVGEGVLHSQVVSVDGATPNSQVDLTPSVEQLAIFYEKDLAFVTENTNGVVTVYAIGQKPANDYTIQVTITEVAYE